jgi:hypothetical protein
MANYSDFDWYFVPEFQQMFYITHSLPTLQFTDLVLSSWTSGTRRDKTAINIEFCFFLQLLGATKYIDFTKSLDEIFL